MAKVAKKYFVRDKSGRDGSATLNTEQVQQAFKGQKSWHGERIYAWIDRADVGDKWENNALEITRTQ